MNHFELVPFKIAINFGDFHFERADVIGSEENVFSLFWSHHNQINAFYIAIEERILYEKYGDYLEDMVNGNGESRNWLRNHVLKIWKKRNNNGNWSKSSSDRVSIKIRSIRNRLLHVFIGLSFFKFAFETHKIIIHFIFTIFHFFHRIFGSPTRTFIDIILWFWKHITFDVFHFHIRCHKR